VSKYPEISSISKVRPKYTENAFVEHNSKRAACVSDDYAEDEKSLTTSSLSNSLFFSSREE